MHGGCFGFFRWGSFMGLTFVFVVDVSFYRSRLCWGHPLPCWDIDSVIRPCYTDANCSLWVVIVSIPTWGFRTLADMDCSISWEGQRGFNFQGRYVVCSHWFPDAWAAKRRAGSPSFPYHQRVFGAHTWQWLPRWRIRGVSSMCWFVTVHRTQCVKICVSRIALVFTALSRGFNLDFALIN